LREGERKGSLLSYPSQFPLFDAHNANTLISLTKLYASSPILLSSPSVSNDQGTETNMILKVNHPERWLDDIKERSGNLHPLLIELLIVIKAIVTDFTDSMTHSLIVHEKLLLKQKGQSDGTRCRGDMTSAEQFAPEISNYYYDQQQSNPRLTTTNNSAAVPTSLSAPTYYPNAQYSAPDSSQHGPVVSCKCLDFQFSLFSSIRLGRLILKVKSICYNNGEWNKNGKDVEKEEDDEEKNNVAVYPWMTRVHSASG
uniref:PXA domain-containing protein n=1 Tax=Brugia pahangi TaxID=6280 RepID=A0A0N4TKE3_BRUPA